MARMSIQAGTVTEGVRLLRSAIGARGEAGTDPIGRGDRLFVKRGQADDAGAGVAGLTTLTRLPGL